MTPKPNLTDARKKLEAMQQRDEQVTKNAARSKAADTADTVARARGRKKDKVRREPYSTRVDEDVVARLDALIRQRQADGIEPNSKTEITTEALRIYLDAAGA